MPFNLKCLCGLLLFFMLGAAGGEIVLPAGFEATYALRAGGVKVGTLQRSLVIEGSGAYRFESRMAAGGLIAMFSDASTAESSSGTFIDNQIVSERYHYQRQSGKRSKEITVEFERPGTVAVSRNGATNRYPAPAGTHDKLSYQLALMADLAAQAQAFAYTVADDDSLKTYSLSDEGKESIDIAGRSVATVKLVYRKTGSSRSTTLWCAADYGYLPVRIAYQEKDGVTTTATLTAYRAVPGSR